MPTINSTLSLAKRALIANQGTMANSGDNVANVNTPGYARHRARLGTAPTDRTLFGGLGSGVELYGVTGLRDRFVEQQYHSSLGDSGWFSASQGQLETIEGILGEVGDAGLSGALDRFWNAWHDLSTDPTSGAARGVVRETAQALVDRFHNLDRDLKYRAEQIDAEVAAKAARVNEITAELARLNREFTRSREPSPNLEDRRTQLLDELAGIIDFRYRIEENGSVALFCGGASLVMGTAQQPIEVRHDSEGKVALYIAGATDLALEVSGGEVGALLDVRDGELVELRRRLDGLASTLAREVNRIHATGYGLDGSTGNSFFSPDTGGMADIALSDDVTRDLNRIATSADGLPGDNRIALAIAELEGSTVMSGGRETISQAYQSAAAWFGARVAENRLQGDGAELALQQVAAWRDAVSGVSLDEEMAELIRFQQAFNAAAKVVGAADTMMQTVIALVE